MSSNSCESALQTAPIVSDLPRALRRGGLDRRVGRRRRDLGALDLLGLVLGHALAHRAR